jgi:hypothetical protein
MPGPATRSSQVPLRVGILGAETQVRHSQDQVILFTHAMNRIP